ncbi:MAG: ABC transporter ATP-binding protein [Terracoccus sp.]
MSTSAIETTALTKGFGAHRGILGLDLAVRRGEVFGFLGPNGAGKTTAIRVLMGLHAPDSGRARVLGLDPTRDRVALGARTGYLPGDLVLVPRQTGRQLADRFARVRGLGDTSYRDELVERLGVDLDRPTQTLSKGNRQKIGIVLAFMHRPELLVLDEPTSGLDPLLQNEFGLLLEETTADGRTVFLSSHDLDEVQRVVDRLAIIREGRIVVTDTVEGLRSHAPRTMEVTTAHDLSGDDLAPLRSLTDLTVERDGPRRLRLTLTGPVGPVLRAVAELDPVDLRARPADLDELFLGYYRPVDDGHHTRHTDDTDQTDGPGGVDRVP